MNEAPLSPVVHVDIKLGEHLQQTRVADGTRCADLFEKLAPRWRGHVMVVVNGRISGPDDRLKKGDRVVVLPKMGGG